MALHEISGPDPTLRRQCWICLKYFREMTEAQWRANAPYHFMSIRHQRSIQVRKSSAIPGDPAVLRYEILQLIRQRERSGAVVILRSDVIAAFKLPAPALQRQLEVLDHRRLLEAEDFGIRLKPEAYNVIDAAERDLQDLQEVL
jgi:hypothetical protein